MQSEFEQQAVDAIQLLPHSFCPDGQPHPPDPQTVPLVHAGCPLQVHTPAVHVLVVLLEHSLLVQQSADGMHEPLHSRSPDGHAHPAAVHVMSGAHGMSPLQVQVPALHMLVAVPVQSLLEQQSADGMQLELHFLKPAWQVHVPPLQRPPDPQSEFAQQPEAVVHLPMQSD